MLETVDLSNIQDENARQLIRYLLNLIEDLSADLRDARAEIQHLRDENNRLKGEQGKPTIKPSVKSSKPKPPRADHSSEKERSKPNPRVKRSKTAALTIHREETLSVDKATLPADAEFKGHVDVVVQDVVFHADNVCFHREKYWSRSTNATYTAEMPRGYEGQFGPGVRALSVMLYFGSGMSEPKISELYAEIGVQISAGQLSNLLIKGQDEFHAEKEAACEAGLRSSPWQHSDSTSTRVNGENQNCHIVCNPLHTTYKTTPRKDRLSVLDVLRQGRPRMFRLNDEALGYLHGVPMAKVARNVVYSWQSDEDLDEQTFLERLDEQLPKLGVQQRQAILGAAGAAAYHAEEGLPVVRMLLCDDAPQYNWLTEEMSLCWVHEGRHYKKLTPVIDYHRQLVTDFLKQFWDFYDQLLTYRQHPTPEDSTRLEKEFDRLFATRSGYDALDERIVKTRGKKAALLMVLKHPEIPLHNNPAELEARRRVRKRDVSFGPRTQDGVKAWDTFMSLAATTRKLGISFYQYVHDRISKTNQIPPLASLIEARAEELALGASWSAA